VIDRLKPTYPLTVIGQALGWGRSSYYYQAVADDDEPLGPAIEQVLVEFPTYGYRRVTHQWQRQQRVVNHKRVRRLMQELGLTQKVRRRRCRTTDSAHSYRRYPNLVVGLEIVGPDPVWVCDITSVRRRQEFIYLAVMMAVFTRSIRGWE